MYVSNVNIFLVYNQPCAPRTWGFSVSPSKHTYTSIYALKRVQTSETNDVRTNERVNACANSHSLIDNRCRKMRNTWKKNSKINNRHTHRCANKNEVSRKMEKIETWGIVVKKIWQQSTQYVVYMYVRRTQMCIMYMQCCEWIETRIYIQIRSMWKDKARERKKERERDR